MNILFLDIDGVLNACDGSGLNTDKVALLKTISDATDCRIVLSSSWRLNNIQLDRAMCMCQEIGSTVVGVTPHFTPWVGAALHPSVRCQEITDWILRNSGRLRRTVILDDEADMGPLSHLHVRTDSHTGLTEELAREVISRFTNTPKP